LHRWISGRTLRRARVRTRRRGALRSSARGSRDRGRHRGDAAATCRDVRRAARRRSRVPDLSARPAGASSRHRGSRGGRRPRVVPLEPKRPGVTGLQLLDIETYLPGDLLPKADLASMAHSLELRSPFLDHEVVALGLALPDSLKTRGREGKVALRRAFALDLPT